MSGQARPGALAGVRVAPGEATRMRLIVNGTERDIVEGATVASLLEELAIRRDGTAVALNDDVVPRAQHAERALRDGDRLEIIVAVAGG